MRQLLAGLVALTVSGLASASTDCTASVVSITIETGSDKAGYIVDLDSGLSFAMLPTSQNSRQIMNLVSFSEMQGRSLTLRFAANGVDCKRKARRTDLIAIVMGKAEETVVTTPPPAVTITPTPRP